MNTWEIILDGYKSPFVRELSDDIEKKANFSVDSDGCYTKTRKEYCLRTQKYGAATEIIVNAFKHGLSEKQILEKYGISSRYIRQILIKAGLVEPLKKAIRRAVLIIHESGEIEECARVRDARIHMGMNGNAFRNHIRKKGKVAFVKGKKAVYKDEYEAMKV
jgi:hypothetical protein